MCKNIQEIIQDNIQEKGKIKIKVSSKGKQNLFVFYIGVVCKKFQKKKFCKWTCKTFGKSDII